jgi:hypothetical protein
MKNEPKKNGQVLIIFAIAVVVLLGFTALAVDGTMVYSQRRTDQSTADSAAMAGAGKAAQYLKTKDTSSFSCGSTIDSGAEPLARAAAIDSATADNITLLDNDIITTKTGVVTSCGTSDGKPYIDIHTMVTNSVKTYFLKMVSGQPTTTTVDAVARVYINTSFAGGNTLVTTSSTCGSGTGGIFVSGGGAFITVQNGGVYSASCINVSGGPTGVLAYNGLISYLGSGGLQIPKSNYVYILNDPNTSVTPNIPALATLESVEMYNYAGVLNPLIDSSLVPTQTTTTYSSLTIPPMVTQDCSSLTTRTPVLDYHDSTIYPGYYPNGIVQGSGALTLASSDSAAPQNLNIYCIGAGQNVTFSQKTVSASGTIIYFMGAGTFSVTGGISTATMNNSSIYLTNGNFDVNNGSFQATNITVFIKQGSFYIQNGAYNVIMSAPGCSDSSCGVGPSIRGVLVYMPSTNTGSFNILNGNNIGHTLSGTVFAPNANATISGNTQTQAFKMQMIVKSMVLAGSSNLTFDTSGASLYSQGSLTIELRK